MGGDPGVIRLLSSLCSSRVSSEDILPTFQLGRSGKCCVVRYPAKTTEEHSIHWEYVVPCCILGIKHLASAELGMSAGAGEDWSVVVTVPGLGKQEIVPIGLPICFFFLVYEAGIHLECSTFRIIVRLRLIFLNLRFMFSFISVIKLTEPVGFERGRRKIPSWGRWDGIKM